MSDSQFADLRGKEFERADMTGARFTTVILNGATSDEQLDRRTEPLVGPGWPDEGATFPVRECLLVVLNEEWCHRMYAERDLAVLEERA